MKRHKLGSNLTPVTLESFNKWKQNRQDKKVADENAARKAKETRMKAGRQQGMSGRDLFDFNPSLAMEDEDDEDAIDLSIYERRESYDDDGKVADGVANMSLQEARTDQ